MPQQDTSILPLYPFFERLRHNDFPLGLDDYQRLLDALTLQFNLGIAAYGTMLYALHQRSVLAAEKAVFPKKGLLSLCKLLWLKPNQSVQLFEELFEEAYGLDFTHLGIASETAPAETPVADRSASTEPGNQGAHPQQQPGMPEEAVAQTLTEPLSDAAIAVRVAVGKRSAHPYLHVDQSGENLVEKSKFLFTPDYFPINKRKVQQNLRAFPSFRESHPSDQIDMEATIKRTVEKGFFQEVIRKKHTLTTSHLLLLLDSCDAMVAFARLSEMIKQQLETIFPQKNQKEKTFQAFYFYNAASGYFFLNKTHTQSVSVRNVLQHLQTKPVGIIIVSDAGAAYGGYQKDREQSAQALLSKLHGCTHKVTWLNPMPADRWKHGSAEVIAKSVAMFEATESGIKNAVDFLKGTSIKMIQRP